MRTLFGVILLLVTVLSSVAMGFDPKVVYLEEFPQYNWAVRGVIFNEQKKVYCLMGYVNNDRKGAILLDYNTQNNTVKYSVRWNEWNLPKGQTGTLYLRWMSGNRQRAFHHYPFKVLEVNMIEANIPSDMFPDFAIEFAKNNYVEMYLPADTDRVIFDLSGTEKVIPSFINCLTNKPSPQNIR